tara:strand:- start:10032 stop:11156 length:1125 start_codon:yes stop_codon:yes gene_type:complete
MIPFSKTQNQKSDITEIKRALKNAKLEGGGQFSLKVNHKLNKLGYKNNLLTTSCTSALEMSAILLDLKKGDEIIMPSYTFVSTANAFLLRGCIPIFVDVQESDLNINTLAIEDAITSKTKAIVVVHYGGVSCDMDKILDIAKKNNLYVIEDAAQCINAFYKSSPLGTLGSFGALSFHNTKNISAGEGGSLIVNDSKFLKRALIVHEKGTNRHDFKSGKISKYEWRDIGGSFILSDLSCALLYSQLSHLNRITKSRLKIWNDYNEFCVNHHRFKNIFDIQLIPNYAKHNAHLFYLKFKSKKLAKEFSSAMEKYGIQTASHYVALHSSKFGKAKAKYTGSMKNTNRASNCLVRLPLWEGLDSSQVINAMSKTLKKI